MANKIKLELTEIQLRSLVDIVESACSVLEEIPIEVKNLKAIKRMFDKNGYTNVLKNFNK